MDGAGGQPAARLYHFAMGQRPSKYAVSSLLLWASTHVMTMSISVVMSISCRKSRSPMVGNFYNYDYCFLEQHPKIDVSYNLIIIQIR